MNTACDLLEDLLDSSSSKIVILVMYDTLVFKYISSLFIANYQLLVDLIKEPSCAYILTDGLLLVVQSAAS